MKYEGVIEALQFIPSNISKNENYFLKTKEHLIYHVVNFLINFLYPHTGECQ